MTAKKVQIMLILLAEDDPKISKLLVHLFNKEGYQVDSAGDGVEALMYADMNNYDVVILDWMMPELNGIEVCKKLRSKGYNGGILMLTAKDTVENKITGLEIGADDYLVKPFEFRELFARVKALERRSTKKIISDRIEIGEFCIERQSKTIYFKELPLILSNREYQLFTLLLENNRQTVTREIILDRIWGIDQDVSQNNLDAFIRLLRKKIEQVTQKGIIINVRGIGYKVEV
jgi:DNA-binding response OmpR family regulator